MTGIKATSGGSDYLDSPTPKTAEKHLKQGYEYTDWYFCKKDLEV